MCETTPPVPTAHLETLLRDKRIACDELFKKCLGDSNACENYIDFQQLQLQSQQKLFNKWTREFEGDETGPMSLDYRLQPVDGDETDADSLTMSILREECYIDVNLQILRGILIPVLER
ncbi:hypothetical protein E5D57_002594 [Metarhizium anisopliae]|nr:hypothetical protein E5D57_002594 [Metarhizium anisopliae]